MLKFTTMYKLLQRKCYDILSLQYAFLLILISCFLFFLSLFHFGEIWFDWSKSKYDAAFSSLSDNIAGKSFLDILCQKVPIDVVYTWVNGSDPLFLKNLQLVTNDKEEAKTLNDSFMSRFEDLEELRYSLRSIEMYAPWVHHIFVVTNGQIPYWLNMDHPRLTVVTHEELFLDPTHLPTFSSPAIESHLHRIPGLSKYFLYLNDDIILGEAIWPEDFLTESNGYKIFVTWNLPDCSTTCSWSWVGDGSCDPPCNTEECSYDGGDCNSSHNNAKYEYSLGAEFMHNSGADPEPQKQVKFDGESLEQNPSPDATRNNSDDLSAAKRKLLSLERSPLYVKNVSANKLNINYLYKGGGKPPNVKEEIMVAVARNDSGNVSLSEIVRKSNKKWIDANRLARRLKKNLRRPMYERKTVPVKKYIELTVSNATLEKVKSARESLKLVDVEPLEGSEKGNSSTNPLYEYMQSDKNIFLLQGNTETRRILDMFAESLLHVNRLYNSAFGVGQRKVPAHMPHFINKDIMIELQERFPQEWRDTSSHKLRSKKDMQFAFSYFYFLIGQKVERNVSDIFDEFDTDGSGTWSDREVRTLLTRIYGVPLSYPIVLEFEELVVNCSKRYRGPEVTTPLYERYYDSKLPTITKGLIEQCSTIVKMLRQQFGAVPKYKYEFVKEAQQSVVFKMITSNLSKVIEGLDVVRSRPRKFICLNNNMDPNHDSRENEIVKAVLQDFYQSLYPKKSSFELGSQYRNRFLHVEELRQWKKDRDHMNFLLLTVFFILGGATLCSVCQTEIRWCCRKVLGLFKHHKTWGYSERRTVSQI